jgi:hypothetical protein
MAATCGQLRDAGISGRRWPGRRKGFTALTDRLAVHDCPAERTGHTTSPETFDEPSTVLVGVVEKASRYL